ncbi:hypothetical protein ALC56_03822, partial [Trachymyrmex septentrionalis]
SKDVSRFRLGGKFRDTFKISHFLRDVARIPPRVRVERLWESNSELSIRTRYHTGIKHCHVHSSAFDGTMSLTKRIDEIRLLESRKSARLADQDTDFARLADMAGDRKRASSHSIDVPHVMAQGKREERKRKKNKERKRGKMREKQGEDFSPVTILSFDSFSTWRSVRGSRKRRPSSNNDSERTYSGWGERVVCGREGCRTNERGDCMDECAAALVLMSLSCSPHSPHNPPPLHCQYNYGSWGSRGGGGGGMIAGSPGVGGMSNSSSSSGASWRSGTPSPPLSEEGVPTRSSPCPAASHPSHNQPHYPYNTSGSSSSSTPGSTTLDEGIVPDYIEEQHPRKKIRAKVNQDPIETEPGACATFESEQANAAVVFKCNWPGCLEIKATVALIEEHVRQSHLLLGPKKSKGCDSEDDHEEEFYYQEVAVDHMSSPPTMSHRDMARPPHEDPEYQKQLRLEATPAASNFIENGMVGVREPSNTFTISQSPDRKPGTPNKHIKLSPRPLQACHQQNMTASTGKPSSPRRTRSDVKKCRKIYGMDSRDLWCTQCRWKKACTRFCSE